MVHVSAVLLGAVIAYGWEKEGSQAIGRIPLSRGFGNRCRRVADGSGVDLLGERPAVDPAAISWVRGTQAELGLTYSEFAFCGSSATQYRNLLERMNNWPSLTAGVLLKSPLPGAKWFWAKSLNSAPRHRQRHRRIATGNRSCRRPARAKNNPAPSFRPRRPARSPAARSPAALSTRPRPTRPRPAPRAVPAASGPPVSEVW